MAVVMQIQQDCQTIFYIDPIGITEKYGVVPDFLHTRFVVCFRELFVSRIYMFG